MRILMTPIGSAGDNYPFLGLGAELRRRGHDVAVATSGHFQRLVEQLGLEYVELGSEEEFLRHTTHPDLFHPSRGFQYVMGAMGQYMTRLFDVIERRRADGPMAVVAHSLDFASRAWQDKLGSGPNGLPVVRIHLQPSVLRTTHDMPVMSGTLDLSRAPRFVKRLFWWAVDQIFIDRVVGPIVNEMRARLGLAPARRVFDTQMHSPLLTVGLFPEWYAPRQPDWPACFRQTGFPLFDVAGAQPVPAEVETFLDAGDPPIVFTPGSAYRFGHAFFDAAVGACRQLNRRGMLLTRFTDHLPASLPPGVAHFAFAPLSEVLPRCAALVHHGGIGTTAAALAGGVPQVIMPLSHDQPDNAHRIRLLGVGDRLMPKRFTASHLAATLVPLLESRDVRTRCADIAARCRSTNAVADTCDLIESAIAPVETPHTTLAT